jgi:hypothetical protein
MLHKLLALVALYTPPTQPSSDDIDNPAEVIASSPEEPLEAEDWQQ